MDAYCGYFGLLCALFGTRFFMVMGDGIDYASGSALMLFLTGAGFTFICVKSFIHARKMREANQTVSTSKRHTLETPLIGVVMVEEDSSDVLEALLDLPDEPELPFRYKLKRK